jgi:hypothetical protein
MATMIDRIMVDTPTPHQVTKKDGDKLRFQTFKPVAPSLRNVKFIFWTPQPEHVIDLENWETAVDFTKIQPEGVDPDDILKHL